MPRGKVKDRDGIYQRKDRPGTWWASWIDAHGKRRQRKLEASTLQQARTLLAAEKARVEKILTLGYAPPSEDSLAAVCTRFLKHQKAKPVSAAEYERETGILEKHVKPFFGGDAKLKTIRRADVQRYITHRTGEVSAGSVIKEMNVLKRLLQLAVEWEIIPTNPAHGVKPPQTPEGRTRYLSPNEFKTALEAAQEWMRAPMALAAFTGMRRSEILGLRWCDVDLENQRLFLGKTKNGAMRVLALNGLAVRVLKSLPASNPEAFLFAEVDAEKLSVYTRRVFATAGIKDASFHSLRHTAASWLVMEGVDIYAVGQILGHKTPRMTQRYAHLSPGYMATAVGKLDGVFGNALPAPPQSRSSGSIVTQELPKGKTRMARRRVSH
jgi:integrase